MQNPLTSIFWIEKDRQHIGYCSGIEDGKRIIDELLD